MYRNTILKLVDCDLRQLPLGAVEAFVLAQVDGRLSLEEIAAIAGLEFADMARIAERLRELGAVEPSDDARTNKRFAPRAAKKATKAPPASRSQAPAAAQKSMRPAAKQKSMRPSSPQKSVRPSSSQKSMRPSSPQKSMRPADAATSARPSTAHGSLKPSTAHSSLKPSTAHSSLKPSTVHSSVKPSTVHGSGRPSTAHSSVKPSGRAERRSSRPAMAPSPMRIVDDVTCELDDVTRARITDLEAKLDELDHYALLDITRDADKKTVKRAYFALASKFHPDRFFGKKLGPVRVPLERIFDRLTTAHDALVREELRAAYDATLPPAPRRASSSKGLVLRPSSRKMKRVTVPPAEVAPTPPPRRASRPVPASPPSTPSPGGLPAAPRPPAGAWPRRLLALSSDRTPPAPDRTPPSPDEALRRMYASAKQGQVQRRVDIFLGAADEALRKDDVIAAANNYRLALQNTENPEVRKKLEAIEALAKSRHYEQSITRARAAEKAERWVDAATYFAKANAARPEASSAERAAHALRLSGGDLHRAAELAQQAILADPKNAGYHVTLGEIFLAAKLFTRAAGEATRALEIAPKDERAKRLAAALPKKKT